MKLTNLVVVAAIVGIAVCDPNWQLWLSQTISLGQAITFMTGAVFLRVPTYMDLWANCHLQGRGLCFKRVFHEFRLIIMSLSVTAHAAGWYKRDDNAASNGFEFTTFFPGQIEVPGEDFNTTYGFIHGGKKNYIINLPCKVDDIDSILMSGGVSMPMSYTMLKTGGSIMKTLHLVDQNEKHHYGLPDNDSSDWYTQGKGSAILECHLAGTELI